MAVSKIHTLYNTLGKAISYITNPDKTDGGCLVSSFGCSIETAAIEMKLTADQGRNIGNRIGYHISFYDLNKYHHDNKDTQRMHEINDKICSENDWSVVEKKSVDEKLADKSREKKKYRKGEDISLRAKLKMAIEEAISRSGTFEEFLQIMKLEGYDYAYRGKMLRFQVPSLGNSKGYSMIRLNGKNMYITQQNAQEASKDASLKVKFLI